MFCQKITYLMLIISKITKKASSNNEIFANQAIKQGFNELIDKFF